MWGRDKDQTRSGTWTNGVVRPAMAKSGYKPASESAAHSVSGMAHTHIRRGGLDPVQGFEMQYWGFRDAVLPKEYENIVHWTCHEQRGSGTGRPEQEIAAMVKTRKLKYFGHISRHASLEKDIMLGMMPGLRRQGGQRKQWIDDLTEWSNNSIPDLVRKAQDRSAYQRFVYKVAHSRNSGTAPWLIDRTISVNFTSVVCCPLLLSGTC